MTEKTKNILSLNHTEAMDFFLKSEQYHGFELPEYFVFDNLLQNVKNAVGITPYEECLQEGISPEQLPDVNLDILLNKDGRYAVRPIILANPFLYYFLVREICNEQSWTIVKQIFETFTVQHITSCALPTCCSTTPYPYPQQLNGTSASYMVMSYSSCPSDMSCSGAIAGCSRS